MLFDCNCLLFDLIAKPPANTTTTYQQRQPDLLRASISAIPSRSTPLNCISCDCDFPRTGASHHHLIPAYLPGLSSHTRAHHGQKVCAPASPSPHSSKLGRVFKRREGNGRGSLRANNFHPGLHALAVTK